MCLFGPEHVRVTGKLSERAYSDSEHVIVSYNGDLRGIVEDVLDKQRRVRCSVARFGHVATLISGSALLATVPEIVARQAQLSYPKLRTSPLPFPLAGAPMELLWPLSLDDDEACRFVREQVVHIAREATHPQRSSTRQTRRKGARAPSRA